MSLLKYQDQASPLRGMPTTAEDGTSVVVSITGETIQMYYNSSGTLTADAGQAAGVAVVAKTAYDRIRNQLGDTLATNEDNSLTFTSTALTTEKYVGFEALEAMDEMTFVERLAYLVANKVLASNGDYCVDYLKGVIYGIKASTQTTLASGAYKIKTAYVTVAS